MEREDNILMHLQEVSFAYETGHPVLMGVSFQARAGESIGLVGANGMGKSTLMKLFTGLCRGYQGAISICGLPVEKRTLPKVRQKIGYVFQDSDSQLFCSTVYEDVMFGPRNYGLPEEEVKKRAQEALAMVHIEHLRDKPVYQLSGGEKKLASIATILSMSPRIILMDEPTVGLDPKNRRNFIGIIKGLRQLKIIASHDLDMILDTCERTILLSEGRIVKDGKTIDILTDGKLLDENGLELPLGLYGQASGGSRGTWLK